MINLRKLLAPFFLQTLCSAYQREFPLFVNHSSKYQKTFTSTSSFATTSTSSSFVPAFQFRKDSSALNMNVKIDMESSSSTSSPRSEASDYNSFASAAVDIVQADTSADGNLLTFIRSARDIDGNKRRRFLHHIMLKDDGDGSGSPSSIALPPTELPPSIKARIPSPSGNKIAVFTKDDEDRQIIEIWASGGTSLSRKILIPKALHGDICMSTSYYGSFQWNEQEDVLLYCAEMNPPKTKSFFDHDEDGGDEAQDTIVGGTNTLGFGVGENWGEKFTTTCRLKIFAVNVDTGKVEMVKNVPGADEMDETGGGYTLGHAMFSPTGDHIVYVAWDAGSGGNMPKRLGSIYCYQRHAALYMSPIRNFMKGLSSESSEEEGKDGEFVCLTPDDRLARSPRFIKDKNGDGSSKLAWLSNEKGFDTHDGCMGLHVFDWDDETGAKMDCRKTLVDIVDMPKDCDAFPGLFLSQLPLQQSVSEDGNYMFVTSQVRSITKVLRISLSTGDVQPLNFNLAGGIEIGTNASQTLLCMTKSGGAFVTQSEPNTPKLIGYVSPSSLQKDDCRHIPSTLITELGPIAATSTAPLLNFEDKLRYEIIRVHPPHGNVKAPVEGILLLPPDLKDGTVPLIVVPHGGPHSCIPTSYFPSYAYLSQAGKYGILLVNYRGSTGFGQAPLESLAGNVGTQDVKDVVHLTKHVLEQFSSDIDATRIGVCGGSHGGFLTGHLIGQYPEMFKVAAMRNPVTNVATMTTATDIPDWNYVESFGPNMYDWKTFRAATKEELSAMWEASPVAHIGNVKAPTLIAIGNSDKRVPPSQGIEYFHALRSRGVDTKLLLYEKDDHAIDNIQSEADHWINIKKWFDQHL